MTDLKERFSMADEIGTRDLWGEARRRAAITDGPVTRDVGEAPMPKQRRLAAAAVAFAVFASAAVFGWDAFHPDVPSPRPRPSLDRFDLSVYPEGWTRLPDPPEVRSDAATAWTGRELLIWGGYEWTGFGDVVGTGLGFDPASGEWYDLPAAPLEARSLPASAWTGEELLIWGGQHEPAFPNENAYFDDGAAYDPVARRWRTLPPAPVGARAPFSVWTGHELIVWGNSTRDLRYVDGAAYDPATDAWRLIADAPIELTDATAVWTGDVMIVFGAALHGGNFPESETAIGATYNPATDTWQRIADSDLSPQASTAAWDGRRMIGWDSTNHAAAYSWTTDTWWKLPNVDIRTGDCPPQSVGVGRFVFGDCGGTQVLFYAGGGGWHDVSMRPEAGDIVVPIAAGPVVFVFEYDREVVGDRRMFVYTPPVVRTNPRGEVLEPEPFIPQGAERDGDLIRLPVVFPDGSRATLVYPISIDLASLGVQPDLSYAFRGRYQGPIVFLHDSNASIARFVEGTEPVGLINSERRVEIWRARADYKYHRAWLRYRLTSWTVLVPLEDPSPAEQVAASLEILETMSGFPVVGTSSAAELAEGFGEAGGAQLGLGDEDADPDMVSQLNATVFLSPDGCSPTTEGPPYGGYGSSCLGGGTVFASIYGISGFVPSVIEGLRVEDFRPA